MKLSIKYILIFFVCALFVLLLTGRRFLSNQTEFPEPDLVPLEEQYSDDELAVYEVAFNKCIQDIQSNHTGAEKPVIVSTCLCTAKRVMRAYINADNPDFKGDTYNAAKDKCYEITVKHMS